MSILEVMAEAIDAPEEMSLHAPRIITVKIPVDKIGEVIGPKGKMINQIQDDTGAQISIEDDGTIYIGATNGESAEAARSIINGIANPTMPEVGERYLGTVVKTTNFGAFVSLLPGKDGLLHISKLRGLAGGKRVENVEDVVSVGQKIQVEIGEIDDRGKLSLIPVVDESAERRVAPTSPPSNLAVSAAQQKPGTTRTLLSTKDGASTGTRTVLPGGLRVVTEAMPGVRSASIGVWVGVGSRDESPHLSGASHFLEHLLFKGTPTRTALDISVELDEVGGEFNAFTAKEYTCFHARVLDEDLPLAVDVLGDMITSSTITAEDVEAEREVILDEIAMHDDDPDDVVQQPLRREGVGRLAAGPSDRGHRRVDPVADPRPDRALLPVPLLPGEHGRRGRRQRRPRDRRTPGAHGVLPLRLPRRHVARARCRVRRGDRARRTTTGDVGRSSRPFEQVNLVLGVNGLVRTDERRYALGVLNAALGGGTSSRLFQEVRERRGLAYSVYSYASHYSDAGTFARRASAACRRKVTDVLRRRPRRARPARRRRHLRGRARSAARASCAAAWCSRSRTPAPGCPGSPRPSCSTTSCPASTRCCAASRTSRSTT